MNKTIGDIYKNAEDNKLCLCLIQKGVRKFTEDLIRNTRPWLSEEKLEATVAALIQNGYEEYKKERENGRISQIKRSFKNIISGNWSKKCGCKLKVFGQIPDNCKCDVTCRDAFKSNDIMQPFGRLVAINRSYRLKLKHLNQMKYGHLDTEVPYKKLKLDTPEKESLEMANFNRTRSSRRFSFNTRDRKKRLSNPVANSEESPLIKVKLEEEEPQRSTTPESLPSCSSEVTWPVDFPLISEKPKEEQISPSAEAKERRKSKQSLSTKKTGKVRYCKDHCPKCIQKQSKEDADPLVIVKKENRRSVVKFVVEEVGVDALQEHFDCLRLNTEDYYSDEWNFSACLEGSGRKRKCESSTVKLLEEIRQKHVEQLKEDLKSLQDHFTAIKTKHQI